MKMRHPRGNLPGQQVSAPHPRGCSSLHDPVSQSVSVGPAPAGMLRGLAPYPVSVERRPRTRGDAPTDEMKKRGVHMSAPHPRGCSDRRRGRGPGHLVGPAPAGMLPRRGTRSASASCRPRTRGDAPMMWGLSSSRSMSAPHPRGRSGPGGYAPTAYPVGPAPAGMLRRSGLPWCRSFRRPRTRGDAPLRTGRGSSSSRSAPHPRGCSPPSDRAARLVRVGPAPAGMLPRSSPP